MYSYINTFFLFKKPKVRSAEMVLAAMISKVFNFVLLNKAYVIKTEKNQNSISTCMIVKYCFNISCTKKRLRMEPNKRRKCMDRYDPISKMRAYRHHFEIII